MAFDAPVSLNEFVGYRLLDRDKEYRSYRQDQELYYGKYDGKYAPSE